jgi:rubrerythrin
MKEEEHDREFSAWLDEMPPEERSQFEEAFSDTPCE